jgi:hypothetical protein
MKQTQPKAWRLKPRRRWLMRAADKSKATQNRKQPSPCNVGVTRDPVGLAHFGVIAWNWE